MNNSSRQNSTPFQANVHFRRIRRVFFKLCNYESIETSEYNFSKMKAYTCMGSDLNGRNVRFSDGRGKRKNKSCWANNEEYEVVEVPAAAKKGLNLTGKFLLLARNKINNYWIFGVLTYTIDRGKSRVKHSLFDYAAFRVYGKFSVSSNGNEVFFNKELKGIDCNFGGFQNGGPLFDSMNIRKNTYNFSIMDYVSKINGNHSKENKTGLFDVKKVKIYKKKH